jgi:hypothetical protein
MMGAASSATETLKEPVVALDHLIVLDEFMGDAAKKGPQMPSGLEVRGRQEAELLGPGAGASSCLPSPCARVTTGGRSWPRGRLGSSTSA